MATTALVLSVAAVIGLGAAFGSQQSLWRSRTPSDSDVVANGICWVGGPNYFMMDPNALYEIPIDNNGDTKEDMSFQFRFKNDLAGGTGVALPVEKPPMMVEIPLVNAGETMVADRSNLNVTESYTVKFERNGRRTADAGVLNAVGDAKHWNVR